MKKRKVTTTTYSANFNSNELLNSSNVFIRIEKDLSKEMINRNLMKSFREIKKMDRIEINSENIKAIESIRMEQLNSSLYMFMPFISKGVMVFDMSDESMYMNFTITEINMEKEFFKLFMDIYTFSDGHFAKFVDFECTIHNGEKNQILCSLSNCKYNYIYYEKLIDSDVIKLSDKDHVLYGLYISNFINNHGDDHHKLMRNFMNVMVYLNNCIEYQKDNIKKIQSKSNSDCNNRVIKINNSKNSKLKDQIIIINGIKIKKGENSQIKTRQGNLIINRQTQIWGVMGHFRHYKNGKTIYIQPYKKGPGRNKEEVSKTIYKLKTDEK